MQRDIQLVLERWGNWSKHRVETEVGYSSIAAGFKGLLPEGGATVTCTEDDALIIDSCLGRLKQKRPDEYNLLFDHYVKNISKRAIGRRLKLSEGMIRIKFQMAEGFIEGCLAMLGTKLEMDQ
ncbi:antiterminator Q family protein [Klebsiella pneumoniae]|uniref:antiterminator Q family protein n=1 Tax=Klebsiella pneumoniae complex TaxID=3390273 RepID=UPI00135FC88E|nr:antiterminator Q family protein [Klebsiella pneumoniae]HDN2704420.1 antitermination protein Q [Klebsiella aerogenes]MXR92031.1 antitermination protein Q [Klebsiella pneumoniae]MXS55133.1 antitermination protein Q [Klebsiella pneumoniae]HBQ2247225.1 antitermination protein Q [Klebsiella pneumoniae]HBS6294068.1 antitermination protein Q [Klebsiella pneumoniae]